VARTPIVRLGSLLIATVQEELAESEAMALQEELSALLEHPGARSVLLDLSAVQTGDSFPGRVLNDTAAEIHLFGAATIVAGIQPAVAITLAGLGLQLRGVRTALNARRVCVCSTSSSLPMADRAARPC